MSDIILTILNFVFLLAIGFGLGSRYGRRSAEKIATQMREWRNEERKQHYTGQKCVECQSPDCDIYPAVCDTCGAYWLADMRIEGEPRTPLNHNPISDHQTGEQHSDRRIP